MGQTATGKRVHDEAEVSVRMCVRMCCGLESGGVQNWTDWRGFVVCFGQVAVEADDQLHPTHIH